MLQLFFNVGLGMFPQDAVEAPRVATRNFPDSFWPHPSFPGLVAAEGRIPRSVGETLTERGHTARAWPDWEWRAGAVCTIMAGADGILRAGTDPRRASHAIGW